MTTGHGAPDPQKVRIANSMGKASILMEALPYIQRFRGQVVVVKYGGSTMEDPALQQSFAGDITLLHTVGILPVVVHGGGPQISEAMATAGLEPSWVDGLRVTDAATMKVVQRVLVGEVNADIVQDARSPRRRGHRRQRHRCRALSRHSEEMYASDMSGTSAVSTPGLIERLLARGSRTGGGSHCARAGEATCTTSTPTLPPVLSLRRSELRKLVYLTDVEGVLADPCRGVVTDPANGAVGAAVVCSPRSREACFRSCRRWQPRWRLVLTRAHILDGRVQHVLLLEMFTREGIGTMVTQDGDERP
jgi:acetylglutamate kinase